MTGVLVELLGFVKSKTILALASNRRQHWKSSSWRRSSQSTPWKPNSQPAGVQDKTWLKEFWSSTRPCMKFSHHTTKQGIWFHLTQTLTNLSLETRHLNPCRCLLMFFWVRATYMFNLWNQQFICWTLCIMVGGRQRVNQRLSRRKSCSTWKQRLTTQKKQELLDMECFVANYISGEEVAEIKARSCEKWKQQHKRYLTPTLGLVPWHWMELRCHLFKLNIKK